MITIQDVLVSVRKTLQGLFPGVRVYKERIKNLETPSFSVEIVRLATEQESKAVINKKIDLDIIYFSSENRVDEALSVYGSLMRAFSMGIYARDFKGGEMVDKRFIHCLKTPEYKLVDQDLHFLITFDYADEYNPYFLADDDKMKEFAMDTRGMNLNDKGIKDYVFDVDFEDEDKKKAYEEEPLKYMKILKTDFKENEE